VEGALPRGRRHVPNHEANPLKDANIADLRREVVAQKADVGIRVRRRRRPLLRRRRAGERVGADLVTALLAQEFLAKEKGAAIVYDLRASRVLPEEIVRLGGRPLRERVGHSFIKATMRPRERSVRGRALGPLLLPRPLLQRLRHARPWCTPQTP